MISMIDKNDRASLCVQLKNILIQEIREGNLKPNKRISGERVIAKQYGVSRGTAVEALKLLEEDGYIERIAVKGTFVAESVNERLSKVNILFPFPKKAISRNIIDYSNWVIDTEIYHGLLDGASKYNVSINFQHWKASEQSFTLMQQIKKVRNFDAVFITDQFPGLLDAVISEGIPYLFLDIDGSYSHPLTISYQRKKAIKDCASYIADCGYQNVGVILDEKRTHENNWKVLYFQECLKERGLKINENSKYYVSENEEKAFEQLTQMLPMSSSQLPEIFFCEMMTSPVVFLRLAHERQWRVGKDIDIMGYAGETAMRAITPSITYLKVPYVEIGKEACRLLYEKAIQQHNKIIHHEVPANIIQGISSRKLNKLN